MRDRYVILKHQTGQDLHWDLMLEREGTLKTFRLRKPPKSLLEGDRTPAEAIQDHEPRFLTYEGPVQGGKGSVAREDQGDYETLSRDGEQWEIKLRGSLLRGTFQMKREGQAGWSFVRRKHGGSL